MTIEMLATIEGTHKSGSYFNVGIVLWDDKVIEAGPIVGFMKGWSRDRVRDYCKEHDWKVSVVWQTTRRDIDAKGRSLQELRKEQPD